jgi:hypothetical protein
MRRARTKTEAKALLRAMCKEMDAHGDLSDGMNRDGVTN